MTSTNESKKESGCSSGDRRHGPPTEEERQKRQAEFKQEFLDEYRKRYGDALISSEQTWELYQALDEHRHAQMKERHQHRSHSPSQHGSPPHFEEKRKQILSELQQDFAKDFSTAHGTNKVNAEQAWSLIQKVKHSKHEKWEADRQKHGHRHGPEGHGPRSPPTHQ